MQFDPETIGLTDLVHLQDHLAQVLRRRFGRVLAIAFTDVVGSTEYFARFGDHAGRLLHQRHLQILHGNLGPGRIVDVAGDGAFSVYPAAEDAARTLTALQVAIGADNQARPREHHLAVRAGMHWGSVLTDGTIVSGESVNLCARVCGSATGGEIRVTRAAFLELPTERRKVCEPLPPLRAKGIAEPIDLLRLAWSPASDLPERVRIEELGAELPLPARDTITFGRLSEPGNPASNDVVLVHPDPRIAQKISRWQFELRRGPDGFKLRAVSDAPTEVDGVLVAKGSEVPVRAGTTVKVARALTVTLLGGTWEPDPSRRTTPSM
jgi:class 3 adenylate cyclase